MAGGVSAPPIVAAGGVVWRARDGDQQPPRIEVAIVHRPRYDDWSIPKGKLSPGESVHEAALREVFEETGYRVRLGRPLGEVHYMKATTGGERPKVVYYWAMRADGGLFTPNAEVDGLRWLSVDDARAMVTRSSDADILARFNDGPVFTTTILLTRHASAGSRSKWKGDDVVRPLDEAGVEQAEQLVRILSRYGVRRIVSADFVRCLQTVEPLAEAIGVTIEHEPLLSELGYPGHEEEMVALIHSIGDEHGAVVLCSQGDVIPDLLQRLSGVSDLELSGDFDYKKASVWALSFAGGHLVAAEYHPPPRSAA